MSSSLRLRALALLPLLAFSLHAEEIALSSVVVVRDGDSEHARAVLDKNAHNHALRIAGHDYAKGLGTQVDHASWVELNSATRFTGRAGVDDATESALPVHFELIADGRSLWKADLKKGDAPAAIDVDVHGAKTLALLTQDIGNNDTSACADWVEGSFAYSGERPKSVAFVPFAEPATILTPKASPAPRFNGARVFGVRPGHPFLFRVAVGGERPMKFSADGLPPGLTLDAATGRITGQLDQAGTHRVTLHATNARGSATGTLRIEVGERIALTPPMGWNSWNSWGISVDQEKVYASAKAMADHGLVEHGWTYVNIDDTWQGLRTGPGHALQGDEKFPDLKKLCDDIHALGMKAGIYSTPWVTSYATFPGGSADNPEGTWTKPAAQKDDRKIGKYSFAAADAKQWAAWGIDCLKYDWNPNQPPETGEMSKALRDSGRDILFSLSNSAPFANAAVLATLANAWRTTGDINDTWGRLESIGFSQEKWRPYGAPGHWNDPDMLVVGNVDVGRGKNLHPSRLTPNEQYTHLSLWCLLSAPLLIGCPIEQADAFTLSLLTNDEVLALDQDELGQPAAQLAVDGRRQIWVKQLADGSRAVGLFNLAQTPQEISVSWSQLGLSGAQAVRDLWRQKDLGTGAAKFSATVPRHGVVLIRVSLAK